MKADTRARILERLVPAYVGMALEAGRPVRDALAAADVVLRMDDRTLRNRFNRLVDQGVVAPLKIRGSRLDFI